MRKYIEETETTIIICGYCYHDQVTHSPDGCPYKKGSRWDLDGLFAPDSTPFPIGKSEWAKDEDGRYRRKP